MISSSTLHGVSESAPTPVTRSTGPVTSASSTSIRAVLPMPGSPSIETTRAEPVLADRQAARRTATSFSRPTKTFLAGCLLEPCDTIPPRNHRL